MEEMIKNKRARRSKEERVAEIDEKINNLNQSLDALEDKRDEANAAFDEKEKSIRGKIHFFKGKKEDILSPTPKKRTRMTKKRKISNLLNDACKSGLTPEDIARMLGLSEENDQESE